MTKPLLIDPTFRRARIVRFAAGFLVAVTIATLLIFGHGLRAETRPPIALPTPRRGLAVSARRPPPGQRPAAGRTRAVRTAMHPERPASTTAASTAASTDRAPALAPIVADSAAAIVESSAESVAESAPSPPSNAFAPSLEVIAFLDPSARGAMVSLDRHAASITIVAMTGLLLGDRGAVIDRLDATALDVARSHHLPVHALLQNLDDSGGNWRPDRVAKTAHDKRARKKLGENLLRIAREHDLAGIHLDLEELDELDPNGEQEGFGPAMQLLVEAAAFLRPAGIAVWVDVPAFLPEPVLSKIGELADRVVVMAYDENDEDGAPGPIASQGFFEDALAGARVLPPGKLVAGLGIYGYDWIGKNESAPITFVAAQTAAKEARVLPHWDAASGNPSIRYSDDEGTHEVWLLDAAVTWNQLASARKHGAAAVSLWKLGEEDPGVWEAIAAAGRPSEIDRLGRVLGDDSVDNQGDGPFLALALSPEAGERKLVAAGDRIADEQWERLPSPYLVRRAGILPGKVALTFDDGPDPRYTPAILSALHEAGVPAAFFVVGVNAALHPEIVRRTYAEGHEIGNHSFTHPDISSVSEGRLRIELEATSQLVETLIGRRPLLYRPPSLADIEPRTAEGAAAFARAGSLGYLVIDADVDPRDWECPTSTELTRRVLDGARDGGVILLHDGGGDRSTTVQALPAILDGLRARGLVVSPLAELVGKKREQILPPTVARSSLAAAADHAVFRGASSILRAASIALGVGLFLIGLRAILVLAGALASERRRQSKGVGALAKLPSVMIVIPAFNEREVIDRTLDSVLASDLAAPVLVIDDGSTDGTADLVAARARRDPRVRLIVQANAGKAAALRTGFAATDADVIVALDGDTLFRPDTVRLLVEPFVDPRIGAVAGTAEVGNLENALTRCQALEYLVQQEVERRAWDLVGALPVVPGAVGAWRRTAVMDVGGFSSQTLAEDADLAMALCRAGWRVVHAPEARARTEAPSTIGALVKQRVRWSFGVLQAMWKHRGALWCRRSGAFGRLVLPAMIVFQVLLPLLTPAALLGTLAACASGNVVPALMASAVLLVAEAAQVALAVRLARRSGGIAVPSLWRWLLVGRALYRPLLLGVTARSLGRVLDGIPLGWNKLARRGTVSP